MIYDNTFSSISTTGPLIQIEGATDQDSIILAMIGNTFSAIQSYVLTNVLHMVYTYQSNALVFENGHGGVLVQGNTFSDIIGC